MGRTFTISMSEDNTGFAPSHMQWTACWGEFDLDTSPIGYGSTEAEAMTDLIYNYELPK